MPRSQNLWIWNSTYGELLNLKGQIYSVKAKTIMDNMKGTTVNVIAHNMDPYIRSQPNSSVIGGFLGDFWYILEEALQFRSNITGMNDFISGRTLIKNNQSDVFLAALVYTRQTTDIIFLQPYFRNWYHLYFKLPEGKPPKYLHFEAFSVKLWSSLVLFFTYMTIMLWLTCLVLKRLVPKVEVLLSLPTYFMGVTSAFFNTGYDLKLKSCSARLQIFLALFFGVLCYYALSASLVATLAVVDTPIPFTNLESIAYQDTYSLCMRNVSFVYNDFSTDNGTLQPLWQGIVNSDKCPKFLDNWWDAQLVICRENVVVLENRIVMGLVLQKAQCQVIYLDDRLYTTNNYITTSRKFQGREPISKMMMRMTSTGIAQKLASKWIKTDLPYFYPPSSVNQITFSHVRGLMLIYLFMIGVALVILLLEICFRRVQEERSLNKTIRKLYHLPEKSSRNFSTP